MFLGFNFCSDQDSFSNTSTNPTTIVKVKLTSGVYDDWFGTEDINCQVKEWNFDTRFYAKFEGNLASGNVDYAASMVSSIRIKRRKTNSHDWTTLYDLPINTNDDFNFELIDRYAQGCTEYYYALVPVFSGIESNINKNSIMSEFDSYYILDKDISYPIIFNTTLNTQLNKSIGTVSTLGKKYPFVISNGLSQYISGSLQFSLAPMINCDIDVESGYTYRNQFNTWIMNGSPKIIKDWTGQIYMINITSTIPIDYSTYDLPSYQISFTEIGDATDTMDLAVNGFTDVKYLLGNVYV